MSGDETMFGWTAGGGVEWAYAANWTAKVEYAYFDFGKSTQPDSATSPNTRPSRSTSRPTPSRSA